jgi:hypothetical protein
LPIVDSTKVLGGYHVSAHSSLQALQVLRQELRNPVGSEGGVRRSLRAFRRALPLATEAGDREERPAPVRRRTAGESEADARYVGSRAGSSEGLRQGLWSCRSGAGPAGSGSVRLDGSSTSAGGVSSKMARTQRAVEPFLLS